MTVALLAVVAIAGPAAASPTPAPSGFAAFASKFHAPPAAVRPRLRWWWASPLDDKEIAGEVNAIADQGFGGAEIAYDAGAWGTQPQRDALKVALETARARGISMDMTMGASWPVTTPNTGGDSASPYHSQELAYGVMNLIGPAPYDGPLPPAQDQGVRVSGIGGFSTSQQPHLVAVVAGAIASEGTPAVVPGPGVAYQPAAPAAPLKSPTLDPASLVDITSKVDAGGNVHFTPPTAGHWVIFALYRRPTVQGVMDHLSAGAANTVTSYLDANQIGDDNQSLLIPGGRFFEDSLELNFNGIPWTDGFRETFKRLWGYDVTPYLPALFIQDEFDCPGFDARQMPNPDYDVADGVGDRVRYDYLKTIDYLYVHDHLDVFQAWARKHGMRFRAQVAYGSPFDMNMAARELDEAGGIAEVESRNAGDPSGTSSSNWRFALDLYRGMAGGAHQAGQNVITTELGATNARDYMVSLSEYKALMDKEWAAGISEPIMQGLAYQPPGSAWPGRDEFSQLVAQSWNSKFFPEWSMWRALTDYWARGDLVLQSGQPLEDVAVYRDAPTTFQNTLADQGYSNANYQVDPQLPAPVLTDDEGGHPLEQQAGLANPPPFFDGQALEQAGYTFEYIDPDGLLDPRAAGPGVLYPNGPSYRALVIDQRSMPGAVATAIAQQEARGLAVVVVGAPPSGSPSLADSAAQDAEVRAAFEQIVTSRRTRVVAAESDVLGALKSLGVDPGVGWSQPEPVYSQHRRIGDADLWYLWNSGSKAVSYTASFATTGAPSRLDLWTGAVSPIAQYTVRTGRIRVPVSLRPGQTTVIAFDPARPSDAPHVDWTNAETVLLHDSSVEVRDSRGFASRALELSDGERRSVRLAPLPSPLTPANWHLHVDGSDPSGTTPYDLDLTKLDDWRNISAISKVSGVGTYTTTLDVPATWLAAGRGAYLDLGQIDGTIRVYLNGHRVPWPATSDTAYTLPQPAIPATTDRLDVTSYLHPGTNTLRVVMATTLENAVVAQARQGNNSVITKTPDATEPYGLLGPVALEPYASSLVPLGTSAP